ncbi:glycosyltransferase [Nigerium sp.]|uniref:glycosyltransferase n=1 Tax=Nigerium sp. TaxID=2042655 RepID=UPI00322193BC
MIASTVKDAARQIRQWQRDREHDAARIPVSAEQVGPPRALFLTPDTNVPAGGIRVMYRHVDILNSAGIPATILHQRPGFRCTWFDNDTDVTDVTAASVGPRDLLVIGELQTDLLPRRGINVRHVVLNQSGHLTWDTHPDAVDAHYASPQAPLATIVVSEQSRRLVSLAFPDQDVRRVHLFVDTDLFHPLDGLPARRLVYMPRRGLREAQMALRLLKNTGALDGWEVRPLDGLTQTQVAAELRNSRLFLSTTFQEGFGYPVAEAMASGVFVVGSHGFGGQELFDGGHARAVAHGDVLGLVDAVSELTAADAADPDALRGPALGAREFIASTYTREAERRDVVAAYSDLVLS